MKEQVTIRDVVCPFCSLLCDDLRVERRNRSLTVTGNGCDRARRGFGRLDPVLQPHVRGIPATEADALEHAAALLREARQPLIAGMGTDVDGCRSAVALAEACGAIVDHVHGSAAVRNLRVLQSRGWMLSTLSELRNRAELLVLVGTDTRSNYPRFLERFAGSLPSLAGVKAGDRRIAFIGPAPKAGARAGPLRGALSIPCTRLQVGEVIAVLRSLCADREPQPGAPWMARGMAPLRRLRDALRVARYSAFVWAPGELDGDHGDVVIHDICELVAELNSSTRSAGLALAGNDGGASCINVMTWQCGYPLRVNFASGIPDYDPLLWSAPRALEQGGADVLLWINSFSSGLKPPRTDIPVIALTRPSRRLAGQAAVYFPVGVPGLDHDGTLFRTDSVVSLPLRGLRPAAGRPAAELLALLKSRV